MEKYYRFAGVEIAVRIPDDQMYTDDRQLAPFRVQDAADPHVFCYERVASPTSPSGKLDVSLPGVRIYREGSNSVRYIGAVDDGWENAYLRVSYGAKISHVQVKENALSERIGVKTVLNSLGAEHLVAQAGGFLFHCAYVDAGGKAILFTAPSGTGKSTQAELWAQYRGAEIVNGDRAAVRLAEGVLLAEGIPFAGSSQYCNNKSLPIQAIVYLGQAPKTSIRKLRGYEAFSKIWEGISVDTWDKTDMESVSGVVQRAAATLPVFHLTCTPDESAVRALEEALRKQESL